MLDEDENAVGNDREARANRASTGNVQPQICERDSASESEKSVMTESTAPNRIETAALFAARVVRRALRRSVRRSRSVR